MQTPPSFTLRTTALHGKRIVLADDDPVMRAALALTLAEAGVRVRQAADGRAAVLAVVAAPCDLLITDLDMPGVDGLQAVAILRWDFGLTDLPVLVVSTDATAATPRLLEAGADACLVKPIRPATLTRVAAACLQRCVASGEAPPCPDPAAAVPFVPGEAEERLGGRSDLLRQLCRLFVARHAGTAGAVAACIGRGDRVSARRLVHALRGTSAQIGAAPLRDAAARLETALTTGAATAEALATLTATLGAACRAVQTWLDHGDDTGP